MNETKMMEFVDRAVGDVGAVLGGAMVVIGDKLGLYRSMAGAGPLTPAELAARTHTAERYVREWLSAQAARGYVSYEGEGDGDGLVSLPAEHAVPLAEAYPASTVVGFDAHEGSVDAARKRAADAGLADRVRFEVASAKTFGGAYDLVCFFDCLHDMGDPAGACAHVRNRLAPDGTLMLIEPFANDDLADNLNPVGAAYYGFSTLLCTPSSLSQDVGAALGAQAGEERLREVVIGAGFKTLRRVAETPFNIVLEAKA